MKLYKHQVLSFPSRLAFYFLFPLFFFYHYFVTINLFPPFLGGFIGEVVVFFFPWVFLSALLTREYLKLNVVDLMFWIIILFNLMLSVIYYFVNVPVLYAKEVFLWSLAGIAYNTIFFLMIKNLGVNFFIKNSISILVLFLLMGILVIYSHFEYGTFDLKQIALYASNTASYQGFGRVLLVFGFILVAVYYQSWFCVWLVFFITAVLYLSGARTEFFLFIISWLALFLYSRMMNPVKLLSAVLYLVCCGFAVFLVIDYLPDSRILIVLDLHSSESFQSRWNLTSDALDTIAESFVLGSYGSYAVSGATGNYSHNILSAWVNLGLPGFIIYLMLLFIALHSVFKPGARIGKGVFAFPDRVAFLFAVFTVLALLLFKNYLTMYLGIMCGFVSNALKAREYSGGFTFATYQDKAS